MFFLSFYSFFSSAVSSYSSSFSSCCYFYILLPLSLSLSFLFNSSFLFSAIFYFLSPVFSSSLFFSFIFLFIVNYLLCLIVCCLVFLFLLSFHSFFLLGVIPFFLHFLLFFLSLHSYCSFSPPLIRPSPPFHFPFPLSLSFSSHSHPLLSYLSPSLLSVAFHVLFFLFFFPSFPNQIFVFNSLSLLLFTSHSLPSLVCSLVCSSLSNCRFHLHPVFFSLVFFAEVLDVVFLFL